MENAVQLSGLAGAAMILGAYASLQFGRLSRHDVLFNLLNLIGSLLLTVVALVDMRWGFILLEGVWALLSLHALLRPRALP